MAKKANLPDPLGEISESIVRILQEHAQKTAAGSPAFLTWKQVLAKLSGVSPEWARAALLRTPAKGSVLVAIAEDPESPVALETQREAIVRDAQLVLRTLKRADAGFGAGSPVRPVSELVRILDRSLQKAAEEQWSDSAFALPPGFTHAAVAVKKKMQPGLHEERYPRLEVVLCRSLLKALQNRQSRGGDHYPVLLSDLLQDMKTEPDDLHLPLALQLPEFADSVTLVAGQLPEGLIAFRSDMEPCLGSESLLRRLLQQNCSETQPEVRLTALAKRLSKPWQQMFVEAWRTHFDLQHRFGSVEMTAAGSEKQSDLILRDARFPRPEKIVAQQLVKTLESQKVLGGSHYPATWSRLAELAAVKTPAETLVRATQSEPFASLVLVPFPTLQDSPVVFQDDTDALLTSTMFFEFALGRLVTAENAAVPSEKLASLVGLNPLLRQRWNQLVTEMSEGRCLPAGIGTLMIGRKLHFVRLRDIRTGGEANPIADAVPRTTPVAKAPVLRSKAS